MAESGQSENMLLVLKGELGIQQAQEIHQALLQALEQSQVVEVDLSEAREVGLCCLQLLCSAYRSARQQDKLLTIRPGASAEFRETMARAGFPRHQDCGGLEDMGRLLKMEG